MPNKLVKSFAKKTNLSIEEIEIKWNKAKEIVSKELTETDPSYYPKIVTILKKMIGFKENYTLLDKFKKLL